VPRPPLDPQCLLVLPLRPELCSLLQRFRHKLHRYRHHLRPHVRLRVLQQRRQGEGLVDGVRLEARELPGRMGKGQWKRGMCRLLCPPDHLHPVVVYLITIDIRDDVRIHRTAFMIGAGFWVSTLHNANVAQAPRPVLHTWGPPPGQLGLFPEEGGKLIVDLWTKFGAGAISQEVLILDSVKEDGMGLASKDQSFSGAVAGHVKLAVTIVFRCLPLGPFLSRQ
jgi:hypothetical protein